MGIRAKAADSSVYPLDMDGIELRCHMIQPTRTLLGAPGIATRSKDGAPGLTTRSKNASSNMKIQLMHSSLLECVAKDHPEGRITWEAFKAYYEDAIARGEVFIHQN